VRVLLLIVAGLFLAGMAARNGDLLWMALPFLLYLGAGVLLAPELASVAQLSATRQVGQCHVQGSPAIEVTVTVRNQGGPLAALALSDPAPEGVQLAEGQTLLYGGLGSGEELALRYVFYERRGVYTWQNAHVLVGDPLGLFEVEGALPAEGGLLVQPARLRFRRLPLRPRSTLHSPGSIPARMGGNGTDFWGVREYAPGDSLRRLDWRLSARHPRRLFSKEFEQEEIADIGLILDARQKTDLRVEDDRLFEHSVSATAALAEAFLHQGHRVGLLVCNDRILSVFSGYGKMQLNRILRCLATVQTGVNPQVDGLKYLPLRMFSSQALLVVVSPLTQGDGPFFQRIRACGYQGLLVSPDPFHFGERLFDDDVATQLGKRAARVERRLELRSIAQLNIPVIDWPVDQPLYPMIREALNRVPGRHDF